MQNFYQYHIIMIFDYILDNLFICSVWLFDVLVKLFLFRPLPLGARLLSG